MTGSSLIRIIPIVLGTPDRRRRSLLRAAPPGRAVRDNADRTLPGGLRRLTLYCRSN